MNPYKRLFGPDGCATVRSGLTVADAATWTPDDESTPSDHVLDGREWENVLVFPEFEPSGGANVDFTPLRAIRCQSGSLRWLECADTGVIGPKADGAKVDVQGHFISFRLKSLSLDGATSVAIRVTGGTKRENLAGG